MQNEVAEMKDPITNFININEIKRLFSESYAPSKLFESVHSKWYLDKVLIDSFKMVCAEPVKLGTILKWKAEAQEVPHLIEIAEEAFIIPFLKNLKNLLINEEVRNNINDYNRTDDGILRTVLDGTYYNENNFFCNNEKALAIILYYDELGIANPLGSHSKQEKLGMFYWTLGNLDPKIRSSQNAIQLLAIVKAKLIKKYGLQKLLKRFFDDVQLLKTRGFSIIVNGEEMTFKGSVLFCAGDTPASAFLGGFKESVSANRPCRTCLGRKEKIKLHFREDFFNLRNSITHEKHLQIICVQNSPKKVINFWKKRYGVNSRSALMEILDVTQCLPQDAMHLLPEGVTETSSRALLHYCIVEEGIFTLEQFNERIHNFDFGHFKVNKPGLIEIEQLAEDSKLKQSASQMLGLAHTLPFLIGEWVTEENGIYERMLCHVRMLQIVNVCFAYEIHVETTYILARMIELFIMKFNRLYPDWIVPKFHFVTHLPRYIRMFGPGRQQWCFQFERIHRYFKDLVPVVRNFKNMPRTLCYRHQARQALKFATFPGSASKRFLDQGNELSYGEKVLLRNFPLQDLLTDIIGGTNPETYTILRYLKVKTYGTIYKSGSIILLECKEDSFPQFGVITEMFVIDDLVLFIYIKLETHDYMETLIAYQVLKSLQIAHHVTLMKDIIFPYSIPQFEYLNNKFVLLLDHERTEFYG